MPERAGDELRVDVVDASAWNDVVSLFGDRGAAAGCWCMWWRVARHGQEWQRAKGRTNRDRLRRGIRGGSVHAVLARAGDEPVGWCSFGPRESFPRIDAMRSLPADAPPGTWTIVCFFVAREWRRRGVSRRLVEAATAAAFERGAERVEAFPVDPERTSASGAGDAWTGYVSLFEDLGYERAGDGGAARTVVVTERPPARRAARARRK